MQKGAIILVLIVALAIFMGSVYAAVQEGNGTNRSSAGFSTEANQVADEESLGFSSCH